MGHHQTAKINSLARQSITYFQKFIDSYKNLDGDMPEKFSEESFRPVVLAHFYIGRLYNKILTSDLREKLDYCHQSLSEYKWIVNHCDSKQPEYIESVRSEYDVCKDMVTLLPAKMDRIRELIG